MTLRPFCQGLRIKDKAEWSVKKIIGRRVDEGGGIEFHVDWEGNWEPTWEPEVCLEHSKDKITDFLQASNNNNSARKGTQRKRKARGSD